MIQESRIAKNSAEQRSRSAVRVVELEIRAAYAVGISDRNVVTTARRTNLSLVTLCGSILVLCTALSVIQLCQRLKASGKVSE